MADINIERKRRSIWPLLIALVLIAALAVAAWQYFQSQNRGGASETTPAAEMQSSPETTGTTPATTPADSNQGPGTGGMPPVTTGY